MSLRRRESATTSNVAVEEKPPFEIEDTEVPTEDPGVVLPLGVGWDAAEENRHSGESKFADRLKLNDNPVLVKFLSAEPISWQQHFIKQVNKPFVCLRKSDSRGCPLCAIGDTPKPRHMMTVADLSGDEAVVKKLEFGNRLMDDLKATHNGPKGPLTRYAIRLSSHGTGFDIRYTVDVVKDRDLEEEEGITPEDVAQAIDGLEPLTVKDVYVSSYDDVLEVAESLV